MGFDDGFGKRESETDSLGVFGEAAAVEAFENVIPVFGVNAASCVLNDDSEDGREAVPLEVDAVACLGVVEGIFYKVVERF